MVTPQEEYYIPVAKNASSSPSTADTISAKPALVLAEIHGYIFACRNDSGADDVAVSDIITQFLGDKGIFLPTMQLSEQKTFKAVDGHLFKSAGKVQICPTIKTVAGSCRLRNIKAYIMPCDDKSVFPGADSPGEIALGNPFLVHSGLDVTDFLANNIDRLSSLDYGVLDREDRPSKIGKLGIRLLTEEKYSEEKNISELPSGICNLISNGDFPLNDGDTVDYKDMAIGEQDEEELEAAIDDAIKLGSEKLSKDSKKVFEKLISEYKDVFRIRLGPDLPVKVSPMVIKFEGNEKPVKVRQRTYSPDQLHFMRKKCDELIRVGYIYRNATSKWACAPLIVPKPGKDRFRFTVDLRPINAQTKKNVWPMPHADPMLARLCGSKKFSSWISFMDIGNSLWRRNRKNVNIFIHHLEFLAQLGSSMGQQTLFHTSKQAWRISFQI